MRNRDIEAPYLVNDTHPWHGMTGFFMPMWVLMEPLTLPEKFVLAYIVFRLSVTGSAIIPTKAITIITDSSRSTISPMLNKLAKMKYIRITPNPGQFNIYALGATSLRHITADLTVQNTDGSDAPVQKLDGRCSDIRQEVSSNRSTPVQNLDNIINKEKNKKSGKKSQPPYEFKNQIITDIFEALIQSQPWQSISPYGIFVNYQILLDYERISRFLAYAVAEYSLTHGYRGFFLNDHIKTRAQELKHINESKQK